MDAIDQRVRRRCGETIAHIMAAVDDAGLPRKQRQHVRRAVMAAVHGQGDDTVALLRGIDTSAMYDESWLTDVGFGLTPPDPAMHALLVDPGEDGDDADAAPPG